MEEVLKSKAVTKYELIDSLRQQNLNPSNESINHDYNVFNNNNGVVGKVSQE